MTALCHIQYMNKVFPNVHKHKSGPDPSLLHYDGWEVKTWERTIVKGVGVVVWPGM